MTYTGNSPIVGPSPPIDLDKLIAWAVKNGAHCTDELEGYFTTLKQGSDALGLDFGVLAAQWDLETDTGRSPWWRDGLNPAGLGITGDPAQNIKAQTWETGRDAAMAHLAHMAAYVYGEGTFDRWPSTWTFPDSIDHRFYAPVQAGYRASTLADLNGTWAIDAQNNYHGKLASRANRIVEVAGKNGEPPMTQIVFGRVPEPPYTRMIVPKDRPGQGYDVCPPRHNIGFVPHETQGRGTLDFYFRFFSCPNGERCHNALVDWTCDRDGNAAMFNDPNGTREPWASGGAPNTSDPTGFNRFFGSSKRNEILESCEFVKMDSERLTPEQIAWGGARAAYIADQDHQVWSEYPRPSKYGGTHMMPMHTQLSQTSCNQHPDDHAAMVNTAIDIMRKWQVVEDGGTTPPPEPPVKYALPVPVPELNILDGADPNSVVAIVSDEGTEYIFVRDRVRAIRDTPRLQRANAGAARLGPDVKAGEQFTVNWIFTAKDRRQYYLTPFWTRIVVADTERVRDEI